MRNTLLLAVAVLAMSSGIAFAQSSSARTSSAAGSQSQSVSRSASRSVGNNVTVNTGSAASDPSGASDPASGYSGGYSGSYTVRNVPEVIAPSVIGGNPCAVGASAGVAVAGFGLSAGGTWADRACERRQEAALLFNMGKEAADPTLQIAAYEVMCQQPDVREALRVSGKPCAADRPVAAAPVAMTTPAPIAAPAAPVLPPAPKRPEWCFTASATELHAHPECSK